ncbi:nuclease harbi1 [Plakobranchus ocellatus]|uniref:Nuclease harbi1 n=1 Tax=Plakobranchus ocellatus TaxID=259542 RepID=A0AAV4AAN6_9GAST|nr:nuclease harbi1 [Plakobranchus ocellatus]
MMSLILHPLGLAVLQQAPPTHNSPSLGHDQYLLLRRPFDGEGKIMAQAVCDSESNFMAIDVGDYGRHSDSVIFKNSSFGRALLSNNLPIPPAKDLCGQGLLPLVFLGDEIISSLWHRQCTEDL